MTIEDKLVKIVGHGTHKDWFMELEQLIKDEVDQAVKEERAKWLKAVGKQEVDENDNPYKYTFVKGIGNITTPEIAEKIKLNEFRKEILEKLKL